MCHSPTRGLYDGLFFYISKLISLRRDLSKNKKGRISISVVHVVEEGNTILSRPCS